VATAANTIAPGVVVDSPKLYEAVSTPPVQAPETPIVFAEAADPVGRAGSAPEYRDTAMTAFVAALVSAAVTTPSAVGLPDPRHTSTRV
jgi:hypothetical protein